MPVIQPQPKPASVQSAVLPVEEPSVITPAEASFVVIIGAFRVEENAHNLVISMKDKGGQAVLYDRTKGGLYRVASGLFTNRDEALLALQQARLNGFPGAWLLAK